uniref:Inner membrane protein n=1 Tax=Syphacia muris TaxID=451379 RepID=A0A0N5AGF3_9BILA
MQPSNFRWILIVAIIVAIILWIARICLERFRSVQDDYADEHLALYPLAAARLDFNFSFEKNVAPLAVEPCNDYRFGIFTIAVKMPTGGKQFTPLGASGLMIASSYCQLTAHQLAVLQTSDTETANATKKTKKKNWFHYCLHMLGIVDR